MKEELQVMINGILEVKKGRQTKMICRGKGENKEYCDRVIKDILERYDKDVCGKTTNQKGEEEDEID